MQFKRVVYKKVLAQKVSGNQVIAEESLVLTREINSYTLWHVGLDKADTKAKSWWPLDMRTEAIEGSVEAGKKLVAEHEALEQKENSKKEKPKSELEDNV